ncbi:MAG: NADPH:quinone reductase [Ectothiorhodospiraceae bacterium]|nr:NADPH:quinone reductase [Ectothiorhodospiraceae bacterium]
MKAIRIHSPGEPEVMQLETLDDRVPGPHQVLVRVHAIGVNPVETYIRAGQYAMLPPTPYTPGMDCAGTVQGVGEGVTRFAPGDRVYVAGTVTGSYAEQTIAEEHRVHPLPEQVSFQQGAAIGVPCTTAYHALFQRAAAIPGESVLVHGATGGVGIAAIQLAKAAGMMVIATGGTEEGRKLTLEQGADHVLDHSQEGYMDQVMDLTDGNGVDVILEMLANMNLGKDLPVLAHGGRVVIIGSRGPVEINPRDTMGRRASIIGCALFQITPEEYRSAHAALGAGLRNGTLQPVISREMPLADAPEAHRLVMQPGARGKIVLTP